MQLQLLPVHQLKNQGRKIDPAKKRLPDDTPQSWRRKQAVGQTETAIHIGTRETRGDVMETNHCGKDTMRLTKEREDTEVVDAMGKKIRIC